MKENKLKKILKVYLPAEEVEKLVPVIKKDTLLLIDGIQGPTGKTTLCRELNKLGYNAVETWKAEKKEGNENYYGIFISLNKQLI